jgi:hypothetical protein
MTAPTRTRQTISPSNFYKLCDWLKSSEEVTKPHTREELANAAAKALGLPALSVSSLLTALKAVELTPVWARAGKDRKPADRIQVVAICLERLMVGLGMEVPAELMAVAQRRSVHSLRK